MSNFFDYDFGWHLRFGKDWLENGNFPYADTYTYAHFGQMWVNHEWGGDLLYWLIYKNFGYYPLVLFMPLLVISAFYVAQKTYGKYSLTAAIVSLFLIWTMQHIFVARLAIFSFLFFATVWYSLQNPEKKLYRFWPVLFWIWAYLHGSFTLGFIIIAIYFGGNLLNLFFCRFYPRLALPTNWNKKMFYSVLSYGVLSLAIIFLNPYGWHLYKEVISYFFLNFYKNHITEWVASNTYPIFWKTGLFIAPILVAIFYNLKKKTISWAELLLFCALFIATWNYKRQAVYLALFCQPFFSSALHSAQDKMNIFLHQQKILPDKKVVTFISSFSVVVLLVLSIIFGSNIRLHKDIWPNLSYMGDLLPINAVKYLNENLDSQKHVKIFNEFSWGAYMNWTLPQALIFLDSRGTATWKIPRETSTTLEVYYDILYYGKDGLKKVESQNVQYIILQDVSSQKIKPDIINRWLFGSKDLKRATEFAPNELEKSLKENKNWQLIYADGQANIWKNLKFTQPGIE